MTNYYEDERMSASRMKSYHSYDPAIAYHQETAPLVSSDPLRLGSALHLLMEGKYKPEVSPHDTFRTKEARSYRDAHPEAITKAQYAEVQNWYQSMMGELLKHPEYATAHREGTHEAEYYTEKFKARVDLIHGPLILDWKTTRHTHIRDVIREYRWNGSALQAAHYLDMSGADRFVFVIVSKTPPYPVWILPCEPEFIEYGLSLREQALTYREEYLKGVMPNYSLGGDE